MAGAFTVSKMLSTINEVMAPVATETCASVSLKRKMDNGVMLDTSAAEIAFLDMQSKIKHTAQQVAPLDRSERLHWIADQRVSAKLAFDRREFQQAAESYVQALTALDFGSTDAEKREMQQQAQIPLTCNLAACMLMLEQWDKAKRICDQTLALDPSCLRALQQRAKALTKLNKFDDARADVAVAKGVLDNDAGRGDEQLGKQLEKQLADIERAEVKHKRSVRQQRAFQKNMMAQAVGRLYSEKEDVRLDARPAPSSAGVALRLRLWGLAAVQRVVGCVSALLRALAAVVSPQRHIKTA